MQNVEHQLATWSISYKKVTLTPTILDKLGPHSRTALANNKIVDAYTFVYNSNDDEIAGFIVLPKKITKTLPVIIFNRGGTGDYGLIPNGRLLTRLAEMAKWGYVVVGTQYPGNALSEGHDERGGASDTRSVLRLFNLIETLDIADSSNIGMFGDSRGGMMTYLALKEVDSIKAAVTVGGLTNLSRSLKTRPEMIEVFKESFGATKKGIKDRSAVNWVEKMHPTPLCLLHGSNDNKVSPLDALELATRLHESKHPFELHIIQSGDHGLMGSSASIRDDITRSWFDKYLQ